MSKKIIIVGGGSSGWMSAATLIAHYPEYDITLIESPDIKTIGVGESTQQKILSWLMSIDIDVNDFMAYTDASYKLSIKFRDFNKLGDKGFHYPFGKAYTGNTTFGLQDWYAKKALQPETPISDFYETFFPQMVLVNKTKYNANRSNVIPEFNADKDYALHFDATKFASWLREKFSIPKGVKRIESTVESVNVDENGVSSIILSDGSVHSADLYIDCTGFKSLLSSAIGDVEFLDYSDRLPCNKAWAVQIPYKKIDEELENYTNCTALGNGWVWNTPLYSRIGTGYVYSDRFTTDEEALEEFKEYLMSDKMLIPRTKLDIDSFKFNPVKFRTGRQNKVWHKNVVSIGLSAGFIEPLESNGLHTTHEYLTVLSKYLEGSLDIQSKRNMFNESVAAIYDGFFDFVEIHYSLSTRKDTDFWKYMTSKNNKNNTIKETGLNFGQTVSGFNSDNMGIASIMTGHNIFPINKSSIKSWDWILQQDIRTTVAGFDFKNEKSKKIWNDEAEDSLSHYEYLKRKFHSDEII